MSHGALDQIVIQAVEGRLDTLPTTTSTTVRRFRNG